MQVGGLEGWGVPCTFASCCLPTAQLNRAWAGKFAEPPCQLNRSPGTTDFRMVVDLKMAAVAVAAAASTAGVPCLQTRYCCPAFAAERPISKLSCHR